MTSFIRFRISQERYNTYQQRYQTTKFQGTATDSDALGGVAAANYLRSNANDTTSGTLGVVNDSGFTVGADSDLSITSRWHRVVISQHSW